MIAWFELCDLSRISVGMKGNGFALGTGNLAWQNRGICGASAKTPHDHGVRVARPADLHPPRNLGFVAGPAPTDGEPDIEQPWQRCREQQRSPIGSLPHMAHFVLF